MSDEDSGFLHHLQGLDPALRAFVDAARLAVAARLVRDGKVDRVEADVQQRALHGLAWIGSLAEAMRQAAAWGLALAQAGKLGEGESIVLRIGIGEYLEQLTTGIAMSQNEIFRPAELGLRADADRLRNDPHAAELLETGNIPRHRAALIALIRQGARINEDLGDETLDMVRDQFRRFANERIQPSAQAWHLADVLIPDEIVAEMAELGAFGVCINEDYGGLGLGKLAMCVVTEELSRA